MTDCIFCKIIAGEIPCQKLAENDDFLAFLDIAPINKGHALVVPKEHLLDFTAFPKEKGDKWVAFIQEAANAIKTALGPDGMNIGMNNGAAAGQVVMHQHTHLIPRWDDDGLKHWPSKQATPDELEEVQKEITG